METKSEVYSASNPDGTQPATVSVPPWEGDRLTPAEIEQLRQSQRDALDYMQKAFQTPKPDTSSVSERLTNSEIESLRQDAKEASDYLQKVFSNERTGTD